MGPRVSIRFGLLTAVLALVSLPACAADRLQSLDGVWEASGYECPAGVRHFELIRLRQDGPVVTAIKMTGDDCVPAPGITFTGRLRGGTSRAAVVDVEWTGGLPETPACCKSPGVLAIVDVDTLRAAAAPGGNGPITLTRRRHGPMQCLMRASTPGTTFEWDGVWVGGEASCAGGEPVASKLRLERNGSDLVAMKTLDDACGQGGTVLFQVAQGQKRPIVGSTIRVTAPQSRAHAQDVAILSSDVLSMRAARGESTLLFRESAIKSCR